MSAFHISCPSGCLAALKIDTWLLAVVHTLYSCSSKLCAQAQGALCVALSQHCSGPSHALWKLPAGSLSCAFSHQTQIASGPCSLACSSTHLRDLCTHTSSSSLTAMLWWTTLRRTWATSGWGMYWWQYILAGFLSLQKFATLLQIWQK